MNRFVYDEGEDEFVCPQGKRLRFIRNHTHRGRPAKIYRCADCDTCPVRAACTEHSSGFRSIDVRADHVQVGRIRKKINTENGKAIYKKRKAIIEPIFGRWQHNWAIRRLRLRVLAGFSTELHRLAIGHNLTKLFRLSSTCPTEFSERPSLHACILQPDSCLSRECVRVVSALAAHAQ